MLPNFLSSSYRQYKNDTDVIACWLATNAKQCGYPADLLERQGTTESIHKASRLKGKARKKASEKVREERTNPAKAEPSSGTNRPKYIIPKKDFITLADHIANSSKPMVKVPGSILNTINRGIAMRKRVLKHYRDENRGNKGESGHAHFIEVLEKVRDILRPRVPVELLEQSAPSADTEKQSGIRNLFGGLDNEEPSKGFLNSPAAGQSASSVELEPIYEAERVTDPTEFYLATWLLFNDLNDMRKCVRRTWHYYLHGACDLETAAVTTNTAVDLVRKMEDDFLKAFPDKETYEDIVKLFYDAQCHAAGEDPEARQQPGDPINFNMYDVADLVFLPTYVILYCFTDAVDSDILLASKPGFFGHYDPTSDRSEKSVREKFDEDKILLLEVLSDVCIYAKNICVLPVEDELTRGLREMIYAGKIDLWFIFAAQVFLDIHHIMRQDVEKGFTDLWRNASHTRQTIKKHLEFHRNLKIMNWPPQNDHALTSLLLRVDDCIKNDGVRELLTNLRIPCPRPFRLLRENPVLSGLLSFSIKVLTQEIGIAVANAWGSIMYAGHLYHALRQEEMLSRKWVDMELVVSFHGNEAFLLGGTSMGVDDHLKRFSLSMGYSTTSFARSGRNQPLATSPSGPRTLTQLSPVARIFMDRYYRDSNRVDLTMQDIETIVAKSNRVEIEKIFNEDGNPDEQDAKEQAALALNDVFQPSNDSSDRKVERKLQKLWDKHRQLTPRRMLESLRDALQTESLELAFDHLHLHRTSWHLLRKVKEDCANQLRHMYGPLYLQGENQLPFVVGYIFMSATETDRIANLLIPRLSGAQATSKLLETSATAMEGFLEAGIGAAEIARLEHMGVNIEEEGNGETRETERGCE